MTERSSPDIEQAEQVQDTYLVGGPDLRAMSGSVEDDRVIQLHFKRKVNDKDREWLLAAINAYAQPFRAPCNCRYPGSLGGDCDGSCQCPTDDMQDHVATITKFFDDAENADLADETWQLNALPARGALNAILAEKRTARSSAGIETPVVLDGLDKLLQIMRGAQGRSDQMMRVWDHDITAVEWAIAALQSPNAAQPSPQHDHRVYFGCECCEEHAPENGVNCREDIGVMPDGTWLCDGCYSDCDKSAYGMVASDVDDFEFPRFEDLPRPAPYGVSPISSTQDHTP